MNKILPHIVEVMDAPTNQIRLMRQMIGVVDDKEMKKELIQEADSITIKILQA